MIKKWIDKFTSARFFYSDDKMFEGVYGYKAGCKLWGDN